LQGQSRIPRLHLIKAILLLDFLKQKHLSFFDGKRFELRALHLLNVLLFWKKKAWVIIIKEHLKVK
jgi:hypothetical protein